MILTELEVRHESECKGAGQSALSVIAGIAVSVAVPFVAPALAGAIFGSSVMAGSLGWLAAGGTGALLGAAGAALTGNDPLTGALFGGLGAGAVQGLGAFGSTANPLFGGAITGANATASTPGLVGQFFPAAGPAAVPAASAGLAPAAISAAPAASGVGALGGTAGGATGALGASAAPAAAGLGAFQMPWDKLTNAAIASSPALIGASLGALMPPSDAAQNAENAANQNLHQQEQLYSEASRQLANINPEYYAQNAANAARLRTATAAQEGTRAAYLGSSDPARLASENRKTSVAATGAAGQAYNDAYLTALDAQRGQTQVVAGLRPNYSDYASYLANYGVDAEQRQRAKDYAGYLSPFASAFLKTNTSNQAGTA